MLTSFFKRMFTCSKCQKRKQTNKRIKRNKTKKRKGGG